HATRRKRVRHSVTAVLAGLVAIAMMMLLMVLDANSELTEQRNEALAQELVAESTELAGTNGVLAQLLGAASWRLDTTDEAYAAMTNAIGDATMGLLSDDRASEVDALTFTPDG